MNSYLNGRSQLLRVLALALSLLLIAAGCESTSTSTGDDTNGGGSEESSGFSMPVLCDELAQPEEERKLDLTEVEIEFADAFCVQFGDNDLLGSITLTPCGDGLFPEVTHSSDGHIFYSHGVIRFHPADELNDGGASPEYRPEDALGRLEPAGDVEVYVLDEQGDHIAMVSAVVEELTGVTPNQMPLGPLMTEVAILESLKELDGGGSETYLNMSFGTYTCDPDGPEELRERLVDLHNQGVQLFASAGNDETDQPSWPAAFNEVVSVGSVAKDQVARSCFSNYGQVDVFMIGEEVVTDFGTWSGTSFAAPQALSVAVSGNDMASLGSTTAADPANVFDIGWIDRGGAEREAKTFCEEGSGYEPTLIGLFYK